MKHVAVWALLLAVTGFQSAEKKHKYKGPHCLGPFCFEHPITRKRLPEVLGAPVRKGNPYCYQSNDGKVFLNVRLTEEYYARDGVSTELVLSDFPNCAGKYKAVATSTDPLDWKTQEGIGLGSDEQEVLRAYGKPPQILTSINLEILVQGYTAKEGKQSRYGSKMLVYDETNELVRTYIVIRGGKVSAIVMEDTE
jgi:hypothetical protein